ncbi:MAG TPA: LCP family protein [Solirubrobacterales bacterium]|nr:LCP family protein [Solirubrobacterales bacterium]
MTDKPGAGSDPPVEPSEGSDPTDDAGDALPPPSTFAGRHRKAESEGERDSQGMTEEFDVDGIADELSASIDDLSTEEHDELSKADEQEDPPDEFAFEEEEEPEEEPSAGSGSDAAKTDEPAANEVPDPTVAAGEEPKPSDSPEEPEAAATGMTVEADTLALSDVEAAREAAHAGLSKRAKKSTFSHEVITTGSHKVEPAAPEPFVPAEADGGGVGEPPKRRMGWRFVAAAFVIVSSMAAATAVSFLLFLSDIAEGLNDGELASAREQLDAVEGGSPQTILILGSDKRGGTPGDPGRSDTAMLLRVDPDPDQPFLSLLSLPRDLEVPIPGYGPDKLNSAYFLGEQDPNSSGPKLAIETIKEYMGIDINHVVNVDFNGFYEAVNAIDCVYIDVDRHYQHSNEGLFGEQLYAEIDVPAGYTKLCGFNALNYVRYRHEDNDLVRGARQQDFVREARQRIPPSELLPFFGRGDELIDIFTENTSSDINDAATIVEMMKTFAAVREAPVRQVSIGEIQDDGSVEATQDQVEVARNQFLGNDLDNEPAEEPEPKPEKDKEQKPEEPAEPPPVPLIDSSATGQQLAAGFEKFMDSKEAGLPIFYPTQIVENSAARLDTEDSRAGALPGPNDKTIYYMYKYVIPFQEEGPFGSFTSYYGVSGTNWKEPPILKNPSEYRTIDGREYMLFYEQDRLRLVGWKTNKGSYWVINTLTHALSEEAMLKVATSAQELGQ